MKRDMDLVRKILFKIEELPQYSNQWADVPIDGYSKDEIDYHLVILMDAGLIDASRVSNIRDVIWKAVRLTWEGHEFLDAARDNGRWEKAKTTMNQVGGFALDVMKQLLVQYLKTELKLP